MCAGVAQRAPSMFDVGFVLLHSSEIKIALSPNLRIKIQRAADTSSQLCHYMCAVGRSSSHHRTLFFSIPSIMPRFHLVFRCFLPVAAALAFRDTPGLVAAAVHAYCSGDPADKKHGVRMSRLLPAATNDSRNGADANAGERSPPISPRFVETRIAFTRHLYAQLHQAAVASSKAFPQG